MYDNTGQSSQLAYDTGKIYDKSTWEDYQEMAESSKKSEVQKAERKVPDSVYGYDSSIFQTQKDLDEFERLYEQAKKRIEEAKKQS